MNTYSFSRISVFLILVSILSFTVIYSGCSKEEASCTETTWYKDADSDGLGNPSMSIKECQQPVGYVSNNSDDDDSKPAPVDAIADASILSQNIGERYPLRIYIPKEYEDNKKLPVVYLLDGLTDYMDKGRTFDEEVITYVNIIGLKAILVAVGDKTGADRERDFSPARCGSEDGKDFDNFYKFLTEEVIPYIDNKYENDHEARTLIGVSHAGLFTNFALFRENPDNIMFHGFISVDPSGCDATVYEENLNKIKMDFPEDVNLKIHISQAELNGEILYDLLVKKDFPFLEIDFADYPQETHESVFSPSIRRGLEFIY